MSGDQQAFQYAMNQGHSAAWDLDWEKASSFYRVALAEFPENASALTSLALAFFELQNFSEALEYYQRAAKVSPNDPVPMQKVAEIQERQGNLKNATTSYMKVAELYARNREVEKAIQNWIRVTALDPLYLAAHTRLALVYERLGRTTEAMVEYISIASLLQSQGNTQTAIQTVKHALEVVPNSKEANLALTLLQSRKPLPTPSRPRIATGPASMSHFYPGETPTSEEESRPRIDPIQDSRQKALAMLAEILFEQEETQAPQTRKGLTNIVKGMMGDEQDQYDQTKLIQHLSQAIDLQSHGQEKEAANELESAMEAGLESSAASYLLGFMQSKSDQFESAIGNLRKAVQHELFGLGSRLLLALTLFKMDSVKESSVEYLEALRIADSESVSADQAEELRTLYDPLIESFSQESDEKFQKRICENISKMLIRPDWREQIRLARQQLPGQPSGSTPIPLAEMLTEATSSQLVESLAKVNQLAHSDKLPSAMEEAFYALKFAPTYLPLHICIGDLLVQEGRIPEAMLKYSIVAKSYSVRGETNRAINLLRRVTELNPVDMETRNNLIDLLVTKGKVQDTIQEYTKLAESYYNIADLPMARKTYSLAFRYAQQANADRENKVKLMQRMADIDMQSLDLRNAIRVFEQIRNIDPDDEKTRNMLFELNNRLGQSTQAMAELDNYLNHLITSHRTTEALEYINTKIHENQEQPTLYRRLAEIYRLLGRNEEAINQLEMAKELFIQAGNRSAAIEALRTILALNPSNASMYQRMLVDLEAEGASAN
ncbi:MAG: tetratricopeptide repeat protein [Anaerolineales bacterium]